MASAYRRRVLRMLFTGALLLALVALLPAAVRTARTAGPSPRELERACDEGNAFLVTTSFRGVAHEQSNEAFVLEAPSVVLFSDTPNNRPQYVLATLKQVGTVWGLAYRSADKSIYAAAYHKVQLPFGPGGPGAVYRIDLGSGDVGLALTVPEAGPDTHERRINLDTPAEKWAGRTSLGDIDLSEDGSELFVVNLANRRIYRFSLPSGALIGSFDSGAAGEPWADSARPFGLAVHHGYVYHGLVNSAEKSLLRGDLSAHVYRSRPDGSEMTEVTAFALDFPRGRWDYPPASRQSARRDLRWRPWRDRYSPHGEPNDNLTSYPMPMLTDITFDAGGNMVLGFRDRRSDSMPHFRTEVSKGPSPDLKVGFGVGDIVRAERKDGAWTADAADEFFDDRASGFGDEVALGGLAELSEEDLTASGAYVTVRAKTAEGVYWFDDLTGNRRRHEQVFDAAQMVPLRAMLSIAAPVYAHCSAPRHWTVRGPGTVGDVEALCAPAVESPPTPTAGATSTPTAVATASGTPATSPSPTDTLVPTATPTRTETPTPQPLPLYLPISLRERCDPQHQHADVVLVLDTSSSMEGRKLEDAKGAALTFVELMDLSPDRDQVAIVRFDAESEVVQPLSIDHEAIASAVRGLCVRRGTHVDAGLLAALHELQSQRRNVANGSVAVLLTDGVHNGKPGADLTAARRLREAGIRLYTIGLGADVDEEALQAMAGDRRRYFFAPDSGQLAAIYGEIAHAVACPSERFWPPRSP